MNRLVRALIVLGIVGCGGGGIDLALYPVTGTVKQGGSALSGVKVMLAPRDADSKAPVLFGVVDNEGNFEIQTSAGEKGAPLGNYRVYLSAPAAEFDYSKPGKGPQPSTLIPKNDQDPKTTSHSIEVTTSGATIDIAVP
ncbi:MAG: hypothetical protein R3C49_00050 [Planctomycetaceae bacterium]